MNKSVLKTIIAAEWIKSRRSFTPWFLLAGSLLVPLVCFLIYMNRWSFFTPEAGANGWTVYLQMNVSISAVLMLPLWVIMLVALNIYPEQKGNAWKRLFVTPVGKGNLFVGKLIYLYLQVVLTLMGFIVAIGLFGILANILHPSLSLNVKDLPFLSVLLMAIRFTLCLLPMLTIQYVFSLLTKNVLVPATIGLFIVIVSMVLAQGWSYAVYDPYAFPLLFSWNNTGKTALSHWFGLTSIEWASGFICMLVGWFGWLKFKRLSIN